MNAESIEQSGRLPALCIGDNFIPNSRAIKRRQVSAQSAKALDTLGRAIEYLADGSALRDGVLQRYLERISHAQATESLLAANRSVYCGCPTASDIRDHLRAFVLLRIVTAWKNIQLFQTRVR